MLFRKLLRGESIVWPIHRPEPSFKDLFLLAFISAIPPQNVKHLQDVTKQKLEAKLISTKFRIYLQTPYSYHQIRRYIDENNLEGFTCMLPEDKMLRAVIRGLPIDMPPTEIIADLVVLAFAVKGCHNMQSRKTGQPMPLFMLSMGGTEKHKTIFKAVTSIGFVHRIAKEKEKKLNAKKNIHIVPEPPKVNFWEQLAKTAAQRQQPTPTGQPKPVNPPAASTSSLNQNNSPDFNPDIFDKLKNPAVQETFELLEQFIVIATTIPTKYGHLRVFSKLFEDELQI
ncbi:hypothetical protein TNCV_3612271 [Trichonephila clavipes]|nr:hypothetical protein TNCV_3612271 [Trichonephila clavipes]